MFKLVIKIHLFELYVLQHTIILNVQIGVKHREKISWIIVIPPRFYEIKR